LNIKELNLLGKFLRIFKFSLKCSIQLLGMAMTMRCWSTATPQEFS